MQSSLALHSFMKNKTNTEQAKKQGNKISRFKSSPVWPTYLYALVRAHGPEPGLQMLTLQMIYRCHFI